MIKIKTPEFYINEPDILKNSGNEIKKFGKKALIIGGKTALNVVGNEFFKSIEDANVEFKIEEFIEYPSENNVEKFSLEVKNINADMIIGIGGGKVLDLVKAVGERSNVIVITVPTIAATCAAWSALTIIYDDEGHYVSNMNLSSSPKLVLADTKILAEAPIRYLKAGIGDTIAKWYESYPYKFKHGNDITLKISMKISKLALEILEENSIRLVNEISLDYKSKYINEVLDSIIMLAGLAGSIKGGNVRPNLAHRIHNALTFIDDTHETIHGEKVSFGLIVQFILEEKSEKELENILEFFNKLDLPITLKQLGIETNVNEKINLVCEKINIKKEHLEKLNFTVNKELIAEAIFKADSLGTRLLKKYV